MKSPAFLKTWTLPTPGGGRVGIEDLGSQLFRKFTDHAVTTSAATLSYYFLFSLFPFLFFLVSVTTYLPVFSPSMQEILGAARAVLPAEAMALVDKHVQGLEHPRLLTLGLAATLYSASRGVDAVRAALNLAYDVKESRPLWKTQGIAFGVTIGGAVLVLVTIAAIVAGGDLGFWLARHLHVGSAYVFGWRWARWPVTIVLVMFLAALGYYLLPDVKQEFRFITPGSIIGTLASFTASWGFSVYAGHFGSYDAAYGSIGGVIILMTWFYILGLIFLVGGEINATLEHRSPVGKDEGAHAAGEKAPPKEERPSAVPVGAVHSQDAAERAPGGLPPGEHA
ncbi:MAG: YihY family protein [Myxococcales bacterium]|nr:YihY family protein [Myxococcales bacterium]